MSQTKEGLDIPFKILVIGNSTVGKTCLLLRYCNNKFSMSHITTVGVDFQIKRLELNGKKVKLSIWDTAGQEKWRTITTNYYKGANGVLVAYSVDDRKSFEAVETWISSIRDNCNNANISIFLVGNKCDTKDRQVTLEEGENLAKQFNIPFLETSALENINVQESFNQISKMCLEQYEINKPKKNTQKDIASDDILSPNESKKLSAKDKSENKKKCC